MNLLKSRIAAVSAGALLIAGLGAGGGAIAAGTITSGEVHDQSIQPSNPADSSVGSNEITNASIIDDDMNATVAGTLKGIDRSPVLRGPRGPAGPQGEPGVDGVSGFEVVHSSSSQFARAGTSFDRMAYCPYNKIAIGGGYFRGMGRCFVQTFAARDDESTGVAFHHKECRQHKHRSGLRDVCDVHQRQLKRPERGCF